MVMTRSHGVAFIVIGVIQLILGVALGISAVMWGSYDHIKLGCLPCWGPFIPVSET